MQFAYPPGIGCQKIGASFQLKIARKFLHADQTTVSASIKYPLFYNRLKARRTRRSARGAV
jgi:hypothetical protein